MVKGQKQLLFLLVLTIFISLLAQCTKPKYSPGLYAEMNTNKGQIVLQLEFEKIPMTVANFVGLSEGTIENSALPLGTPYFDGAEFHRVVPNHVIQAGIPKGGESRGPGYTFPNEIHPDLGHGRAGMLGMANGGPHTNSSQFYVTLSDRSYLDGNYTVFGHVIEGMETVNAVVQGDIIENISIVRIGRKAKQFNPDTATFQELVEASKKRVQKDEEEKEKQEAVIISTNWPNAISTQSGLKYVILDEGTGQKPSEKAILEATYTGKTLDETLTFSSNNEGHPTPQSEAQTFQFNPEKSRITTGIKEALSDMKLGEKRILILPPSLAYGTGGYYAREVEGEKRFVISPNTTLVLELTLLKIN